MYCLVQNIYKLKKFCIAGSAVTEHGCVTAINYVIDVRVVGLVGEVPLHRAQWARRRT